MCDLMYTLTVGFTLYCINVPYTSLNRRVMKIQQAVKLLQNLKK